MKSQLQKQNMTIEALQTELQASSKSVVDAVMPTTNQNHAELIEKYDELLEAFTNLTNQLPIEIRKDIQSEGLQCRQLITEAVHQSSHDCALEFRGLLDDQTTGLNECFRQQLEPVVLNTNKIPTVVERTAALPNIRSTFTDFERRLDQHDIRQSSMQEDIDHLAPQFETVKKQLSTVEKNLKIQLQAVADKQSSHLKPEMQKLSQLIAGLKCGDKQDSVQPPSNRDQLPLSNKRPRIASPIITPGRSSSEDAIMLNGETTSFDSNNSTLDLMHSSSSLPSQDRPPISSRSMQRLPRLSTQRQSSRLHEARSVPVLAAAVAPARSAALGPVVSATGSSRPVELTSTPNLGAVNADASQPVQVSSTPPSANAIASNQSPRTGDRCRWC